MDVGVRPTSEVMARALGLIYIAGPTVAVASLLLHHSPRVNDTGMWILVALAYAVVPVLFAGYRYLPLWAFDAIIAFATCLVTLCVWFAGDVRSEYAFFYLWATPYAFAFFGLRRALPQLVFAAAAYAVVLALVDDRHPGGWPAGNWLLAVSALAATALLVRALARALQANAAEREEDRRRRALEINDSVLQGVIVARTAHQQGRHSDVVPALDETLERARRIVTDLLGEDEVQPGDLRRTRGAGDDS